MRVGFVAVSVLFGLLTAATAHAASPAAEALFEEGRRLLEEGRTDEACVKLGESYAQEASSGTLLNLALCHEKQGKIATAWAEYRSAARLARGQGRADRAEAAEERAALLDSRLPSLSFSVVKPVPGLTIAIDEQALGQGATGVKVPVDPGTRRVRAEAPGHRAWTTTVEVEEGKQVPVEIPELVALPAATPVAPAAVEQKPAPTKPKPAPRVEEGGSTTAGWITLGAGAGALAVGGVLGFLSLASYDDAEKACPTREGCSNEAIEMREAAERNAWISNVALGVGVVGVGIGGYLVLSAPSSSEGGVSLRTRPLPRGAWLGVSKDF
jgi:tetratricopeptide (TPR) repeat protein